MIDGTGDGEGVRGASVVTRVEVASRGGVPAQAFAAAFNVAAHLVDVGAWFTAGTSSVPPSGTIRPARVLDTRRPNYAVDRIGAGPGAKTPGGIVEDTVAGRGGVPSDRARSPST